MTSQKLEEPKIDILKDVLPEVWAANPKAQSDYYALLNKKSAEYWKAIAHEEFAKNKGPVPKNIEPPKSTKK